MNTVLRPPYLCPATWMESSLDLLQFIPPGISLLYSKTVEAKTPWSAPGVLERGHSACLSNVQVVCNSYRNSWAGRGSQSGTAADTLDGP